MMNFSIKNEFSDLKKVILGTGIDFGGTPKIEEAYDPHSKKNILQGTFPLEKDIVSELLEFEKILHKYDVDILKPKNIKNINQIFSRDIGFVIENYFFISNIIKNREREILGIRDILSSFHSKNIIQIPKEVSIEGGDVIVFNDFIFVGTCDKNDFMTHKVARTNFNAISFLQQYFPDKKIIGFELKKSDVLIEKNCLHLDCCFQPLGLGHLIVSFEAFNNKSDIKIIKSIFPHIIEISNNEMTQLNSNLFSISKNVIVSEKGFNRINDVLFNLGYQVEKINYASIAKMGGLLRCSTLPLVRL